ncbi:TRAP transporter fused permease subunit [Verrucomicrobia bacterium]|jgi:TRAP transporter 4TM/12TM fusion protein|nr:TRAP transporter fused permease subunit [Verrucomicrobiota bacterium]
MSRDLTNWRNSALTLVGAFWIGFQIYILIRPQMPLVERPIHLVCALAILLLVHPLVSSGVLKWPSRLFEALFAIGIISTLIYYLTQGTRLSERMEGIDEVLLIDKIMGGFLLIALLEGVRRLIGWMLLSVLLLFIGFAFVGQWLPDWTSDSRIPELFQYDGMLYEELLESLTMTANGLLGITTSTSVGLVFYFVLFGACYSAIGGGQLFIDIGIRVAGKQPGGAAKAAVVSSSLMGSISGSAVANVATTGLFTIPLMKKTGYSSTQAAGIESIASTGGQLMPPVMGIAAFVMAELLQTPYKNIVLAGIIPAFAFYLSLFLIVDLGARRRGNEGLETPSEPGETLFSRIHLLIPPILLVGLLVSGWSAPLSALAGTGACILTAYLRRKSWQSVKQWTQTIRNAARQAAEVAIPIAAIGLIIEISIQSNLALKFSANLVSMSGGSTVAALFLIIVGCLVMGMGLPTVAAYIIGSILFVPALLDLGIHETAAHMFVMYYCVLSMVTPPVALASYTASGLAQANAFLTSLQAFRLSWVAFLIPLAFVFEPSLIGFGSWPRIAAASVFLSIAVLGWATALEGYLFGPIKPVLRIAIAITSLAVFCSPILSRFEIDPFLRDRIAPIWFTWIVTTGILIVLLALTTLHPRAHQRTS